MFTADEIRVAALIVSNHQFKSQDWKAAMHSDSFCQKAGKLLQQAAEQNNGQDAKPAPEGPDDAAKDTEGNAE